MRRVAAGLLGLSLTATGLALGPSASAAPAAVRPMSAAPAAGQPMSAAPAAGQPMSAAPAAGQPTTAPANAEPRQSRDELPNPLEDKRRDLREQAISKVLSGQATVEKRAGSTVVKVGRTDGGPTAAGRKLTGLTRAGTDQYVELAREKTDQIFVILAEFGDERDPRFPDKDLDPTTPGPATFDGPAHNRIPAPDRRVDNSTVWQPDYDADHYRRLYFGTAPGDESLKQYYEAQSSGRYSVDGEVTGWVKVRYNEARYGRSDDPKGDKDPTGDPNVCSSNVCANTWDLVRDAANQWVADQRARGRTDAEIAAEVRRFDEWDRYDHDGDGIFTEADGYIDHFQIVHAGGDQADGDPYQGEDAIWSHRWYAYGTSIGETGPADNPLGGTQIGDTGLWIGDYTIQPENGGRSVFYHEYGHDLGLPDDYNTGAAGDNNVEHWSLMAQSRVGAKDEPYIGDRGADLGAWHKLQLGWLDYEVVVAGQDRRITLGPEEYHSEKAQAAVVVLPRRTYTFTPGKPFAGDRQFFSGNDDDLDVTMTRILDLTGKSSASLSMKANFAIEADYDFLYFEASLDGGRSWTALPATLNGTPVKDGAGRNALTGSSDGTWADITVPLDPAAGKVVQFRFHYITDGAVSEGGFRADDITVTADGQPVLSDGAEAGGAGWALHGWRIVGESYAQDFDNYYIAGNRSYVSYDRYLQTGPYYYGYLNSRPDWVDHYPYQQGLLITYWNTRWRDNNTMPYHPDHNPGGHPGEGRNLTVDAHPEPIYNLTGNPWRARVQVYDAPFGLRKADSFTLHVNGQPQYIRGQAGAPLFDDGRRYWYEELPNHGVKVPGNGVKIRVLDQDGTSMRIRVYS